MHIATKIVVDEPQKWPICHDG